MLCTAKGESNEFIARPPQPSLPSNGSNCHPPVEKSTIVLAPNVRSFLIQKFDRGKKQHEQGFNFQMKCRALMVHQSLRAKNGWVSKTSWDHVDLCVQRWIQQVSHCDVERSADYHRPRDVGRQTRHQTCTFRQCSALPTHQVPTW